MPLLPACGTFFPEGFVVSTHDTSGACDDNPAIYIVDGASGAVVAGPFASGDKVKITQVPGGKPGSQPMAGDVVAHVKVNGDAVLRAVDAAGNAGECSCLVPPPPK